MIDLCGHRQLGRHADCRACDENYDRLVAAAKSSCAFAAYLLCCGLAIDYHHRPDQKHEDSNLRRVVYNVPQVFLSGAVIPSTIPSVFLFVLSRIMLMTYCLDLTRVVVYAETPEYHNVVLLHW